MEHVWDASVDSFSGAIRVHMSSLRRKMCIRDSTCTNKILRGLGKMYSGGGDITTNIDAYGGEGTAIFVANAIAVSYTHLGR